MSDRPWLAEQDPMLRPERELLKRLNSEQPPSGSVDHGWALLAAEIAAPVAIGSAAAAGGVHAAHAASHAAGYGLTAKLMVGAALAGGAVWGGHALLSPDNAAPKNVAPLVQPAPRAHVTPPTVVPQPSIAAEQDIPEVVPEKNAVRRSPTETSLAEEGRLLSQAHQLVQSGKASAALEVLRASAARYPRSALSQEREVLTIEALGATGASGSARTRAERFLKLHPKSPHIARLQRFVE